MLSFPQCLISSKNPLTLFFHAWVSGCFGLLKIFEAYWPFLSYEWSLFFAVEVGWMSVQAVNVSSLKGATLLILVSGMEG